MFLDFCYTRSFLLYKHSFPNCIDDIFVEVELLLPVMNVTVLIMIREDIVFDVTPSAGKLAGNMKSFREEINKSKAIFLETGMSRNDVNILR